MERAVISIKTAALLAGVNELAIHYAINDRLISCINIKGRYYVIKDDVYNAVSTGKIKAVGKMIKRSLREVGRWEDEWFENWEEDEKPMSDYEYEIWCQDKLSRMGEDLTIGILEKFNRGLNNNGMLFTI